MSVTQIPYNYHHLPIYGGGYVTGFQFSHKRPDILFIRTDIGGCYRFHRDAKSWTMLSPHITATHPDEAFPIAITVNDNRPGDFYAVFGKHQGPHGYIGISHDDGAHFTYAPIPTPVHGNWNGRGTGCRLVCAPDNPDCLYYASQKEGLWKSDDLGNNWQHVSSYPEKLMTFVWVSPDGNTIIGGNASRKHALFISRDGGTTFSPMPFPAEENNDSPYPGSVPQRIAFDGKYIYITLSVTGPRSYTHEMGYSCDSGDAVGGRVLRYSFINDGVTDDFELITPSVTNLTTASFPTLFSDLQAPYPFGFSGVDVCEEMPGTLAVSTICKPDGDVIFLSRDYGRTWTPRLWGLSIGRMDFCTSYMKPEYNGGRNLIHWLSDVKFDPFHPGELWFNTGTGVYRCNDIFAEEAVFTDLNLGLEETVHMYIASPTAGPVKVWDLVGDLGGFAFRDLDYPCENTFADENNNRYITCLNIDYPDTNPARVIVTPRGNWTGETKGGLILTDDYGEHFRHLPFPYGLTSKLDEACDLIQKPNTDSGWVALSSDGESFVWSVAHRYLLCPDCMVVSHDMGLHYSLCRIDYLPGTAPAKGIRVFADRVNPLLFFGFAENGRMFVSTDGGNTFTEKKTPPSIQERDGGTLSIAHRSDIRMISGREGCGYIAAGAQGLFLFTYSETTASLEFTRITGEGDAVFNVGLGLGSPDNDFISGPKAIYLNGVINGLYGFYRSLNSGIDWQLLSDDTQHFGLVDSIDGDKTVFGRFYIASGTMGGLYGAPTS